MSIFGLYKPSGPSSNKVLAELRHAARGAKVGHAGTLDPLAEGVLVVAVGRASTKQLAQVLAKEKEYVATVRLGVTSTTDDEEGEKTIHTLQGPLPERAINEACMAFVGTIMQTPPIYSAIKVGGREAYKRARAGQQVIMQARPAEIKLISIEHYQWPLLTIRVITGPGVYIRALARDIGERLGTGGYLTQLVRTRVGEYTVTTALTPSAAKKAISEGLLIE